MRRTKRQKFRKSGTPVRRTRRRKSQKNTFWDSETPFRLTESLAHRGSPTHTTPSPRPLTPNLPTLVNTTSVNRSDRGQFMSTEGRARAKAQGPGPGPGPRLGGGGLGVKGVVWVGEPLCPSVVASGGSKSSKIEGLGS